MWGLSKAEATELMITPRKQSVTLHLHPQCVLCPSKKMCKSTAYNLDCSPPTTRGARGHQLHPPTNQGLRCDVGQAHFCSSLVISMPWQRCRWLRGPRQPWRVSQTLVGSPKPAPRSHVTHTSTSLQHERGQRTSSIQYSVSSDSSVIL